MIKNQVLHGFAVNTKPKHAIDIDILISMDDPVKLRPEIGACALISREIF